MSIYPAVDGIHVPLDLRVPAAAHGDAALKGRAARSGYRAAIRLWPWMSKAVWIVDLSLPFGRPNRFTPPPVVCFAIKPIPSPERA